MSVIPEQRMHFDKYETFSKKSFRKKNIDISLDTHLFQDWSKYIEKLTQKKG